MIFTILDTKSFSVMTRETKNANVHVWVGGIGRRPEKFGLLGQDDYAQLGRAGDGKRRAGLGLAISPFGTGQSWG